MIDKCFEMTENDILHYVLHKYLYKNTTQSMKRLSLW